MSALDYDAMIAELKAERARVVERLDAAISALTDLRARQPQHQLTLEVAPDRGGRSLAHPYANMSVARAAEQHLRAVSRSLAAAEVATALKTGGLTSKSKAFTSIVYNAMFLHKATFRRDVLGDRVLWSLKEWPEAKVA